MHWDHAYLPLHIGASWITDAPFRETAAMIEFCRQAGILAVEMEAAALYALAASKRYDIVCFALVTNQMGRSGEDFEKGEVSGSQTLLHIIGQTVRIWESLPLRNLSRGSPAGKRLRQRRAWPTSMR
jgi:uridine phosphorylase